MEEDGDEESELAKDVYAYFGLAYYHSECVFRSMAQVCALLPFDRSTAARPRIEERLRATEEMTLGQLIKEGKSLLPRSLYHRLDDALRRRNFLAHRFWFDRIHLMTTPEGMRRLAAELDVDADFFRALDGEVWAILEIHFESLGLTAERFDEMQREMFGRPPDPLPSRRFPKRLEHVDRAWQVTVGEGTTLVLRTVDGDLWQLGDNGLAWCYLEESDGTWEVFAALAAFLPTRVETRPAGVAAFNYTLSLQSGPSIVVARTSKNAPFRWTITKPKTGPGAD